MSFSAVPVLPATSTPSILAFDAAPSWTFAFIIVTIWAARLESRARPYSLFEPSLRTDRSVPITRSIMRGFMMTPPFAIPADTIAICSGVARTCPWPKPLSAVCGASRFDG